MMDNKILKNIVRSLKDYFKDAFFYGSDVVDKDLKTPAFFVRIVDSDVKRVFKDRFVVNYFVNVSFIPSNSPFNEKKSFSIQDAKSKILFALEEVRTDSGYLFARDVSVNTAYEDAGVSLSAFASYTVSYVKDSKMDFMLRLNQRSFTGERFLDEKGKK